MIKTVNIKSKLCLDSSLEPQALISDSLDCMSVKQDMESPAHIRLLTLIVHQALFAQYLSEHKNLKPKNKTNSHRIRSYL